MPTNCAIILEAHGCFFALLPDHASLADWPTRGAVLRHSEAAELVRQAKGKPMSAKRVAAIAKVKQRFPESEVVR